MVSLTIVARKNNDTFISVKFNQCDYMCWTFEVHYIGMKPYKVKSYPT